MGLRVNNNISSLTAQRYLGVSTKSLDKSLERLASGMRINRAADNPAGLVTSEKQRAQIAGLNQAIENSERGVSMVQTAEAALTEVTSLLTKIRGLALDAANSAVNDADSLAANQREITDTLASIDRISTNAQFGSKKLFDGSNQNTVSATDGSDSLDMTFSSSTLATGTDTVTVSGFNAATYAVANAATVGIDATPSSYGLVGVKAGDHTMKVTQASNYATLTGTADITALGDALAPADTIVLNVSGTAATLTIQAGQGGATIALWVAAINDAIDNGNGGAAISTTANGTDKLVKAYAGTGNTIVFKTGDSVTGAWDEGASAAVTITSATIAAGTTLDEMGFAAGNRTATGTSAIVEFDNYANTVTFTGGAAETALTLQDVNGNQVSVTAGATGLDLGTAILTVTAARGNITLTNGTATSFTAGVKTTLTDQNGKTVDIVIGEDIVAGGSEGITAVNNGLVFQIGANQDQTVSIGLDDVSTNQLAKNVTNDSSFASLSEIDVTTAEGAQSALALIDAAIADISTMRGDLGSFQSNTLESNLSNLRIFSENMTAAESTLRDTDFAAEMANFTKNQILLQAGMTVLSNASQVPQAVLSLLR